MSALLIYNCFCLKALHRLIERIQTSCIFVSENVFLLTAPYNFFVIYGVQGPGRCVGEPGCCQRIPDAARCSHQMIQDIVRCCLMPRIPRPRQKPTPAQRPNNTNTSTDTNTSINTKTKANIHTNTTT